MGYSPRGCKELDMTEPLTLALSRFFSGLSDVTELADHFSGWTLDTVIPTRENKLWEQSHTEAAEEKSTMVKYLFTWRKHVANISCSQVGESLWDLVLRAVAACLEASKGKCH